MDKRGSGSASACSRRSSCHVVGQRFVSTSFRIHHTLTYNIPFPAALRGRCPPQQEPSYLQKSRTFLLEAIRKMRRGSRTYPPRRWSKKPSDTLSSTWRLRSCAPPSSQPYRKRTTSTSKIGSQTRDACGGSQTDTQRRKPPPKPCAERLRRYKLVANPDEPNHESRSRRRT